MLRANIMLRNQITAGMIGVGTSLDTSNVEQGSEIYLNGGAISVGSVDAESFQRAGFDIEEDGNIGIDSDQCIGIVTGSSLVLGNDVEINVEGPMAEASDYTAEILLGDGATMTKTESAVLENTYEVAVNESGGAATVDPSIAGNVVPATISNASIGENGELVI